MTHLPHLFAALADDTRFAIVEQLMQQGETPAGDLVPDAGISAPAISRHLKVLRDAGIIRQRAMGTRRLYSVRGEALRAVAEWAISRREFWETSLDRLDSAIEQQKGWPG